MKKQQLLMSIAMLAFGLTAWSQTEIFETDSDENVTQNTGVEISTLDSRPETSLSNTTSEDTAIFNYSKGDKPVYHLGGYLPIPVYVVDGIFVDTIEALNPADIESMSILKESLATSIYGDRGANGVVVVTTKSGLEGLLNLEGLPDFKDDFSFEH